MEETVTCTIVRNVGARTPPSPLLRMSELSSSQSTLQKLLALRIKAYIRRNLPVKPSVNTVGDTTNARKQRATGLVASRHLSFTDSSPHYLPDASAATASYEWLVHLRSIRLTRLDYLSFDPICLLVGCISPYVPHFFIVSLSSLRQGYVKVKQHTDKYLIGTYAYIRPLASITVRHISIHTCASMSCLHSLNL